MIDDPLITALLAPILIPQGVYTRMVTLKLPEATGKRNGISGKGAPLSLLILGDTAAAGVGVEKQSEALAGKLVTKLSSHYKLEWRLEAETGLSTLNIIERLKGLEVFCVDVVIISLGVNDVTGGVSVKKWLGLQEELRSILVTKFNVKLVLLSSIPPMSRFPSLPQPLRWYLGRKSKLFNTKLLSQTNQRSDLEYLDINFPLQDSYIAKDGFHPSEAAYEYWSELVAKKIKLSFKSIQEY